MTDQLRPCPCCDAQLASCSKCARQAAIIEAQSALIAALEAKHEAMTNSGLNGPRGRRGKGNEQKKGKQYETSVYFTWIDCGSGRMW